MRDKTKCESCGTVIWRTPGSFDKPEAIWSEHFAVASEMRIGDVPIAANYPLDVSTEHTPERCRAKRGLA